MIMSVHFAKIISQFLKLNQYELTVVYEKFVRLQRRGNILEIFFLSNWLHEKYSVIWEKKVGMIYQNEIKFFLCHRSTYLQFDIFYLD